MKKALSLIKTLFGIKVKHEIHTKENQIIGTVGTKDGTPPRYVTLGWDGLPTIVNTDGTVYLRKVELILNKKYYPNWPEDKWPVDPITGIKLEIEPYWNDKRKTKQRRLPTRGRR